MCKNIFSITESFVVNNDYELRLVSHHNTSAGTIGRKTLKLHLTSKSFRDGIFLHQEKCTC
jgi:hypothetical protein